MLGRGVFLPRTEEEAFAPELLAQVRDLELQGVSAAESGDVSAALERFSEAIRLLPERASAYNNRAQALRLKGDVAGKERGTGESHAARGRPISPAASRPIQARCGTWTPPSAWAGAAAAPCVRAWCSAG